MAAHVYHWKHGWIPLDHTAALSKAKGDHKRAANLLAAASSHDSGIHTRQDVAKAALGLSSIPNESERHAALSDVNRAADRIGAHDVLPPSLRRISGRDQYGQPVDFTGHAVASSRAKQDGVTGTVFAMHNGSDKAGLDATARGTVFVPDANPAAAAKQARDMTPSELHAQNQGDFKPGEEVSVRVSSGTRIATIEGIAPDGRLQLHIPGHGKLTRSAEDLSRKISPSTRAAEDRRINGDWRKTPTARLKMALASSMFKEGQKAAIRAELARRGV